jgi:glycosyltransferase involved in cell wall biosynthesis
VNSPILSICLPTFQRAIGLKNALDSISLLDDNVLEIVVSNNASTDDTGKIIALNEKKITTYNKNTENIGPNLNIIKVASLSRGQYFMFLSDEDMVDMSGIKALISFLKLNPTISVIYSSIFDLPSDKYYKYYYDTKIYKDSKEKIRHFLFEHAYMSGLCIKYQMVDFKKVEGFQKKHTDYPYPHQLMVLMAMTAGDCAVFNNRVINRGKDLGSDFRVLTNDKKLLPYYSPEIRAHLISYFTELVRSFFISSTDKKYAMKKIAKIASSNMLSKEFNSFGKSRIKVYTKSVKSIDGVGFFFTIYSCLYLSINHLYKFLPYQIKSSAFFTNLRKYF